MRAYVCVCVSVFVCAYTYVYIYIYICICVYVHLLIYVDILVYIYIYIYACIYLASICKDVLPPHHNNSLIYLFRSSCGLSYIGRTNQRLDARIKQHAPTKIRILLEARWIMFEIHTGLP